MQVFPAYCPRLHGKTASQGVESAGNADQQNGIRTAKPAGQLANTASYWAMVFRKRMRAISRHKKATPPRIEAAIKKRVAEARTARGVRVRVMNERQKIANVSSSRRAGVQYLVNLSARTCSCGKWATFRFPCTHAVKVVDTMSLSIADYLHGEHSHCLSPALPPPTRGSLLWPWLPLHI